MGKHIKSYPESDPTSIPVFDTPAVQVKSYPLSSAQNRMYILNQLDKESTAYNMTLIEELGEDLDLKRLNESFHQLIYRHESLRTSFQSTENGPVQHIHDQFNFSIEVLQITNATHEKVSSSFVKPFDLSSAPLIRVGIAKRQDKRHLMIVDMHHIISDAISLDIIRNDFMQLLLGNPLAPLQYQYKDFAHLQQKGKKSEEYNQWEQYWLAKFQGELPSLNLRTDFSRTASQTFEGKTLGFSLSNELSAKIKRLIKEKQCTAYAFYLAIYNVILRIYTGNEDIIIGCPAAGRSNSSWSNVVGMFVNTLATRNYPTGTKTFDQFLEEVSRICLEEIQYQGYQFDDLVEQLSINRKSARNPLFDTMFNFHDLRGARFTPDMNNGHKTSGAKFDLSFTVSAYRNTYYIELEYVDALFMEETLDRLGSHIVNLLEAVVKQPGTMLKSIDLLSEEEKHQLLFDFNRSSVEGLEDKNLIDLFQEQVNKTPHKIALIDKNHSLTFAELNEKSNQLARSILRAGLEQEDIVGIMLPRRQEMIISMLGVLKAGCAYLPLDPSFPAERLSYMVENSDISLLLTEPSLHSVYSQLDTQATPFNVLSEDIYREDKLNVDLPISPGNLAYLIYTSGSTGKPKGIMIEHKSLVNYVTGVAHRVETHAYTSILCLTTMSFDIFVTETFFPLLHGLKIVMADSTEQKDAAALNNLILKNEVDLMQITPSHLNLLLAGASREFLRSIQAIMVGGEAFPPELFQELKHNFNGKIYNMYGPTETTVWSTIQDLTEMQSIDVGKPIRNTTTYILDKNKQLQPIGVAGELCIGGKGLARAYWKREDLTQEKFIENPHVQGEKIYKTGDLAIWQPNGDIKLLGRIDNQVKIRGFRIELGEIEHALLSHEKIKEAVVTVQGTKEKYLLAYYASEIAQDHLELQDYLLKQLPAYMLPAHYVHLKQLPLSPNGKINRKALPEVELDAGENYQAPKTKTEKELIKIWADVLKLSPDQISTDRSFFHMGGHSLRATVMITKVAKNLGVSIPLSEVFIHQSVASLSTYIENAETQKFLSIPKAEEKEGYLLSSAQKRLYFFYQFDKESLIYNMPEVIHMGGELDKSKLEKAFRDLISRHESLRTSFEVVGEEVCQRIWDNPDFELEYYQVAEQDLSTSIAAFIRPFDLNQAPLIRAGVISRLEDAGAQEYLLLVDMHHIISDGVSHQVLSNEFISLYNGQTLPPKTLRYVDFAEWQQSESQQAQIQKQKEYWLGQYREAVPVLDLPTDYPRPAIQRFEGGIQRFVIEKKQSDALRTLAHETGSTLFSLLLTLLTILISKLSKEEDIVIGTVVAGRDHADLEEMIGMFVRTLALRNFPKGELSFRQFLSDVQQSTVSGFENQAYPYEELVNDLNITRDTRRNPLFDILFAHNNFEEVENELSSLSTENIQSGHTVAKFDLTLSTTASNEEIWLEFEYASALFKAETIQRFIRYFQKIVSEIVADPNIKLSDIEILSEAEKKQLLLTFNEHKEDFATDKSLIELFEEQVKINPENIALILQRKTLSYNELNARANQLAHFLLSKGPEKGRRIGILIDRSMEMIIAMLAILKAGATYLPLDTDQPIERIEELLTNSQTNILLTENKYISKFSSEVSGKILDIYQEQIFAPLTQNPSHTYSPDDVAYIIYTSGSTGKPKGVEIYHSSVVNLIFSQKKNYQIGADERILQFSNISFDASVEQIWLAFLSSNVLVLVSKETLLDPQKFQSCLSQNKLTHLDVTPSYLENIKEVLNPELKRIIIGGEACNPQTVTELSTRIQIHNVYGPTETTVSAIQYQVSSDEYQDFIPIGKPLHNMEAYVLGKELELVPIGVKGNLYLGGKGLAKAYLHAPKLTREKFIPNPYKPSERLYNTGDLACWLPDGNLAFMGRTDHQVKIRGFRIELGEVEHALLTYKGIKEARVLVKGEVDKYLVAYYASDTEIKLASFQNDLSRRLPTYMIPAHYVHLAQFPLTSSGKVDRQKLPEPEIGLGENHETAQTKTQEKLLIIWSEVLNLAPDKISIHQSFFELGGHSLRATLMVNKVAKKFEVSLPLQEVFSRQNLASISHYIDQAEKEEFLAIPRVAKKAHYALSSAQKRLYFFFEFQQEATVYNMPALIRMQGILETKKLKNTLEQLIHRHASLRTSFHISEQGIVQKIAEKVALEIEYYEADISEIESIVSSFIRPFDLAKAPLFRAGVVLNKAMSPKAKQEYLLMIDMHHIISDGVSHEILQKEFITLYKGESLPELPLRYIDFAEWEQSKSQQLKIAKQKAFWLAAYEETLPSIQLPTKYPRPKERSFEGGMETFQIGADETAKLRTLANQTDSTLFMLLLSILNVLLSKWVNEEDIVVGTAVAGRDHADLEGLMGMFVRTLALRNYPQGDLTFAEFLINVKQSTLAYFENQAFPYEELIDELELKRDTSRNPLFDVMFILQNYETGSTTLPEVQTEEIHSGHAVAKFDLSVLAFETPDQITLNIEYANALFSSETINKFVGYFQNTVNQVIAQADIKLANIDILGIDEKQQLVSHFNNTSQAYDWGYTVVDLMEQQVKKTPDHIAVSYENEILTYLQLDQKANEVAQRILAHTKVSENDRIAVIFPPSIELIISLVAILKTGASYVAISLDTKATRRNYILADSNAKLAILPQCLEKEVKAEIQDSTPTLPLLELPASTSIPLEANQPVRKTSISSLMYIIYTSGTTGKPKGVMVSHLGLVNMLYFHKQLFGVEAGVSMSQVANLNFDASAFEIWPALVHGGCLHIAPPEIRLNPLNMKEWLLEHNIEICFQPTAIAEYLLQEKWEAESCKLRIINIAGDRLHNQPNLELPFKVYNLYGPTEDTIWTTWKELNPSSEEFAYSIGKPIANKSVFILNKYLQLQAIGVPGELCVAGPGLAQAYVNDPNLTEKKFVKNPYQDNTRLYKTGDLARWLPNGEIEFLGRIDHQVKIRGFRIELGEIENHLLKLSDIRKAVVVMRGEREKHLVAYYVSVQALDQSTIKMHLAKYLPDYMVPSFFIHMASLPLTANGKLNPKALPVPSFDITENLVLPITPTETKLLEIWASILGLEKDKISIEASFFELGGHSLRASLMVNRIARDMKVVVPLKAVFAYQDVKSLGYHIDHLERTTIDKIPQAPDKEYYVLSSAQKRMFFLHNFDKESLAYNMPSIIRMKGRLDQEKLNHTFNQIIIRHKSLRSSFEVVGHEFVQRITDSITFKIERFTTKVAEIQEVIHRFIRPFDLRTAPLIRAGIVQDNSNEQEFVLMIDMHHIISDGLSHQIFEQELTALYQGKSLPPIGTQYIDYAEWEQSEGKQQEVKKYKDFWLQEYKELPRPLELATDYPRKAFPDFHGATWRFELGKSDSVKLKAIARQNHSTMYMMLLAIYNILLSKLSNEEDIIVGTVVAGRDHADLEGVMGMFIRTLPLRNFPKGAITFTQFLTDVKQRTLNCFEHQAYPYEELIDQLNLPKDTRRNPLFDVFFAYENVEPDPTERKEVLTHNINHGHQVAKFDLSLTAVEGPEQIWVNIEYANSLFSRYSIERFSTYFKAIVSSVIANMDIKLEEIEILSITEKNQLLLEFNPTAADFPLEKNLIDLFHAQVDQNPDNIALAYNEKCLSYSELNASANQLGNYLKSKGLQKEEVVGIRMDRSLEMIISILGILKAGGAYLPIDIALPESRVIHMLKDSETKILLTENQHLGTYRAYCTEIDIKSPDIHHESKEDVGIVLDPAQLCYIIYTSGSTGKPKGVLIHHKPVVNLIFSQNQTFGITSEDRILQFSTISFDASVEQIWLALHRGAGLVLIDKETLIDNQKFNAFLNKYQISHLHAVPSFLESISLTNPQYLKRIIAGGEECTPHLTNRFYEDYLFYNEYGPTETTVTSTEYLVQKNFARGAKIPIGKPLKNTRVYILGRNQELLPIGVKGELYIAGAGVSAGYVNNDALNEERFIQDPFRFGEKMYKTGDFALWLPDGNIEFLGRIDNQVKIRGFRIELGEIESHLLSQVAIREAVVLARGSKDKHLIAYLVSEKQLDFSAIKKYLKSQLPGYMVPKFYLQLEEFPQTTTGKIDRKALPKYSFEQEETFSPPETETEIQLTQVWSNLLDIERGKIGKDQSFFELGGHSLRATLMAKQIKEEMKVEIALKDIFDTPTVQEISKKILQKKDKLFKGYEMLSLLREEPDSREHFFFVHDGSGDIQSYIPLSALLPPANYWGFQANTQTFAGPQEAEIETIAAAYIQILKHIQPHGPYKIAGWSLGGVLAFEMALQLEKSGAVVERLCMIDSVFPQMNDANSSIDFSIQTEKDLLSNWLEIETEHWQSVQDVEELWQNVIHELTRRDIDLEKLRARVPAHIRPLIPHIDQLGIEALVKQVNTIRSLEYAFETYQIKERLNTHLLYLKASKTLWSAKVLTAFFTQEITFREIPGDHFSIMEKRQLQVLAEHM